MDYNDLPLAQGKAVLGLYEDIDHKGIEYENICRDVIPEITDMSWLTKGDSVFVKVACNSGRMHPAVTDPKAVEALVWYLKQKGAGKVCVGDQAGVEHVRRTSDKWEGKTSELMRKNGLWQAVYRSEAYLYCFDDHEYAHFLPHVDFENNWTKELLGFQLYLPEILQKVDHIVYLPRLGAHTIAGYTCGVKNAVGFLRDDSRLYLHQRASKFFQLLAEINHVPVIRNKLRFCLTLGNKALTTLGPDFGETFEFPGVFALASTNLIDHDYVASMLIPWLNARQNTIYDFYDPYPKHANFWNKYIVKRIWHRHAYETLESFPRSVPLAEDPCLSHLAKLQGFRREVSVTYKDAAYDYFNGLLNER